MLRKTRWDGVRKDMKKLWFAMRGGTVRMAKESRGKLANMDILRAGLMFNSVCVCVCEYVLLCTTANRDVQNGFLKFGSLKNRLFGFLCRSVVKYKKTCKLSVLCVLFYIFVYGFLNAQLVSNACF